MSTPKPQARTARGRVLSIRLSEQERRDIDRFCERHGLTASAMARAALLDVVGGEQPLPEELTRLTDASAVLTVESLQMLDELRRLRVNIGRASNFAGYVQLARKEKRILDGDQLGQILTDLNQDLRKAGSLVYRLERSLQPMGGGAGV